MPDPQTHILTLLRARGPRKSICPSEVARALYPDDWRDHMDEVRDAARVLAKAATIRITQGTVDLDPAGTWTGPIRLRLPSAPGD